MWSAAIISIIHRVYWLDARVSGTINYCESTITHTADHLTDQTLRVIADPSDLMIPEMWPDVYAILPDFVLQYPLIELTLPVSHSPRDIHTEYSRLDTTSG